MNIEVLQGEWQKDYLKIIEERLIRIRERFDRVFKENAAKMFAERFPLIVESFAMEFTASVTLSGDIYLLNFLELYEGKIFQDIDIPCEVAEGFRHCSTCEGEAMQFAKESKTLTEAIRKYEDFHGTFIGKADFLFELSEALEDCESSRTVEQASRWIDKWFYYYNMV